MCVCVGWGGVGGGVFSVQNFGGYGSCLDGYPCRCVTFQQQKTDIYK